MRSFGRRSLIYGLLGISAAGIPAQQKAAPQSIYSAKLAAPQQGNANHQIQNARQYQGKRAVMGEMTLAPVVQSVGINQPVTVSASCTQGFVCIEYRYFWGDADDGISGPAAATHTYQQAGSYTVYATAQMRGNDRVLPVKSNMVTVTVTAPQALVVTLQVAPAQTAVGQKVQFAATLTPPPANDYSLLYDFGDGVKSPPVTGDTDYAYPAAGDYQATVTLMDSTGAVIATSNAVPITIAARPAPLLTVHAISGPTVRDGQSVLFQASVDPDVKDIEYRFHWNDGTPDTIANPDGTMRHVFAVAGKRNVQVTGLTSETFAGPIQGSCLIVVEPTVPVGIPGYPWRLARRYPIAAPAIFLGLLAGLLSVGHSIRKALKARGLRFEPRMSAGTHMVRLTGPSYPQVSFSLHTGLESALHRVVVESGAQAASRNASMRKENHHG
ncbi:MAG TPA: PKD domain-containing protein [Terracidiphilus sp.]|nr:PKD domain-containing protein [Terracidiphilus sp.]